MVPLPAAVIALLLLAAAAAPAGAQVGNGPPPPEPPPAACVPAAERLCGVPGVSSSAAADALVAATKGGKRRRALRLAAPKRLFGRRAGKALRRSDDAIRTGLASVAAGAAATQMSGESNVTRTEAGGKLTELALISSNLTRGQEVQKRRFRLDASVDSCPDPAPGNSHGKSTVHAVGVYHILTRVRRGRRLITNIVQLRVDIDQLALTTRRADLWAISGFGSRDRLTISNSYSQDGLDSPASFVTMEVDALSPGTDVRFEQETFGGWIRRTMARDNGDPDPFANRTLAGQSYKRLARAFADMVGARVQALAKAAEAGWKTPGKCVKLRLEGRPNGLWPRGVSEVTGRVTPVRAGVTEAALLDLATFNASYVNGPGTAVVAATLPLSPGALWYRFTAPAAAWPPSRDPGLDVLFYSKGGIGRAPITFPGRPERVSGTYSGDLDFRTATPGAPFRLSWSGTVRTELAALQFPGSTVYALTGGDVHVNFRGSGECELSGSGNFDLLQGVPPGTAPVLTVMHGTPDTYSAFLQLVAGMLTITKSDCIDPTDNGDTFEYPVAGLQLFVASPGRVVPTPPAYGGTGSGRADSSSPLYHWAWNLRPG